MEKNNVLGNRIKFLREEGQLTQIELAKFLSIGNTTLSQYESGQRIPSDEIKTKIADYFCVSVDYLLGRTNIPSPTPSDKITNSLSDDPELADFWNKLKEREDLQIFFKQTKNLSPADIKKVMRIIKAIEDEEAKEKPGFPGLMLFIISHYAVFLWSHYRLHYIRPRTPSPGLNCSCRFFLH